MLPGEANFTQVKAKRSLWGAMNKAIEVEDVMRR
jgi:hypothetical protein